MEIIIDTKRPIEAQLFKLASYVCCPLCDEDRCVGHYNCKEFQDFIDKKRKEIENGNG